MIITNVEKFEVWSYKTVLGVPVTPEIKVAGPFLTKEKAQFMLEKTKDVNR